MNLQQLQKEVKAISQSVKKLRESGISERALIVLIQHSAPRIGGRNGYSTISTKLIRAVLDGVYNLESFLTEDEEQ